jgi:LmbE family N-acetylglucosaminyl deacetylase
MTNVQAGNWTRQGGCKYHPDYLPRAKPIFEKIDVSTNSRVLVIVPHVDDEIMGCGGTICEVAKKGAHVKVVHMCGGAHRSNESCTSGLVMMDRGEVEVALRALRCYDCEWVDIDSTEVLCDRRIGIKVKEIIYSYRPDIIFVPCYVESRTDYMRTATMVAQALQHYPYHLRCYVYSYEGVSKPDVLVDITTSIEEKIEAVKERRSQVKVINDEEHVRAIDGYSLSTKCDGRYCERFNTYSLEMYVQIARELGLIS